jgi:chromosome segregation ATPase
MRDWHTEVERLQIEKQKEERNKRLELVADEIDELKELETQFQNAGVELDQSKEALSEVTARNSPEIKELTLKLTELKTAIAEIDVDLAMQDFHRLNARSEFVKQETLVNELENHKDENELAFAEFMAATLTLKELEQARENETEKLKEASTRLNDLRAIPDIAVFSRRINELKAEMLNAQQKVWDVETDRRQMNARMNFLRATIAKNRVDLSVLA